MIALKNVTIEQGDFALRDLDLEVPGREYVTLMGPTGCGKSTLLEAICGLRKIKSGNIHLAGRDITNLDSARRQIGYVPQDQALFPAMRVDKQIEYGLLMRKVKPNIRRRRTSELSELLSIPHLLQRYPHGLSGGEQQRVALARALAFRPRLLCLDEPLSSLDDETRDEITVVLKSIYDNENVSVLHITHSPAEARRLGSVHYKFHKTSLARNEQLND